MDTRMFRWLSPPDLPGDEDQQRKIGLLNQITLSVIGFETLILVNTVIFSRQPVPLIITMLIFLPLSLLVRLWLFRGRIMLAGAGVNGLIFVLLTTGIAEVGTIRIPMTSTYLFLVLLAGMLFNLRGILVTTAAASLAILGLILAENAGLLPTPNYTVGITQWVNFTLMLGITAYLTYYAVQSMQKSMARTRQEIEARKRDQQRIAEALEFNRTIVDTSPIGILIYAASGPCVSANAAAGKILGTDNETLLRLNFHTIATWKAGGLYEAALQALNSGQPVKSQIHYINSFGKELWLNAAFAPFTSRGELHLLFMFEDDTEHQKSAAALRAAHAELEQRVQERTAELNKTNQALEKALRARDEFLAAMSYELRTPLTGILGFSEALQTNLSSGLNERQLKAVRNIENSGKRLFALVNDVLDYSQIQAGRSELRLTSCSLGSLCRASLHAVKAKAGAKRQQLEFNMTPETILLKVDERRILQALTNLLDNAIKFTPEQGRITLAVTGLPDEQQVKISVTDTGIGIQAEDIPHLFQTFVQLDARLARRYEGTGLGLVLVRKLVELHGGSVGVESTFGEGSCFTVSLPM